MTTTTTTITLTITGRVTPIPMDEAGLTLAQWLSPAFPVGAFAYSQGLEQAVAEGAVTDGEGLADWIAAILEHGTARSDAILLHLAHGAADLPALDAEARAAAFGAERLREGDRQGTAFCDTVGAIWGHDLQSLVYPVAVGAAAARAGIAATDAAALYLHAAAAAQVAAAQRLGILGQIAAQGTLARVIPDCTRVARDTAGATLDDLAASAFAADIAGMRHENQEPRLFQS